MKEKGARREKKRKNGRRREGGENLIKELRKALAVVNSTCYSFDSLYKLWI